MVTCSYDGMDMVRKNTLLPLSNDWLILMPHIVWRVNSLHHYSTSTMLLMPNSDLVCLMKSTRLRFLPQSNYPVLVSLCRLWPSDPDVIFCCCISQLPHSSTCCALQDAVLLTTVVQSGYLSQCSLSVTTNQSAHWPLSAQITSVRAQLLKW